MKTNVSQTLASVVLIALLSSCRLDKISWPAVPAGFQNQLSSSYPLEKKFTADGKYEVASVVMLNRNGGKFSEFKVYYPIESGNVGGQFPVVVMVNGSGTQHYKYEPVFRHLASWGFIVVGNDDEGSWDGSSTSASLDMVAQLNGDQTSALFKKADLSRVGLSGHSQGGVGAINAATNFRNSDLVKSLYTASATKLSLARALKWDYTPSKITIPYFMTSGTGVFDAGKPGESDGGIAPLVSLTQNLRMVQSNKLTILARRRDTDHSPMLYVPNGYMVAWFLHTLSADREAAKVFTGAAPELEINRQNWQDVVIQL